VCQESLQNKHGATSSPQAVMGKRCSPHSSDWLGPCVSCHSTHWCWS